MAYSDNSNAMIDPQLRNATNIPTLSSAHRQNQTTAMASFPSSHIPTNHSNLNSYAPEQVFEADDFGAHYPYGPVHLGGGLQQPTYTGEWTEDSIRSETMGHVAGRGMGWGFTGSTGGEYEYRLPHGYEDGGEGRSSDQTKIDDQGFGSPKTSFNDLESTIPVRAWQPMVQHIYSHTGPPNMNSTYRSEYEMAYVSPPAFEVQTTWGQHYEYRSQSTPSALLVPSPQAYFEERDRFRDYDVPAANLQAGFVLQPSGSQPTLGYLNRQTTLPERNSEHGLPQPDVHEAIRAELASARPDQTPNMAVFTPNLATADDSMTSSKVVKKVNPAKKQNPVKSAEPYRDRRVDSGQIQVPILERELMFIRDGYSPNNSMALQIFDKEQSPTLKKLYPNEPLMRRARITQDEWIKLCHYRNKPGDIVRTKGKLSKQTIESGDRQLENNLARQRKAWADIVASGKVYTPARGYETDTNCAGPQRTNISGLL